MASNPILVKKNSFFKLKKAQSAAKLPVKDDSKQMIRQLDAKSEELSKNIKNCKESFISTLKSIVTDIEHHSMTDMNELHQQINDSIDQVSALSQQLNDGDSVINELKKLEERLQEAKIKLNQDRGATVSMQGLHGRRSSENAQTRLSVDESAQKSPGKKL
jgi:chaperonin cofactor prefoldin